MFTFLALRVKTHEDQMAMYCIGCSSASHDCKNIELAENEELVRKKSFQLSTPEAIDLENSNLLGDSHSATQEMGT